MSPIIVLFWHALYDAWGVCAIVKEDANERGKSSAAHLHVKSRRTKVTLFGQVISLLDWMDRNSIRLGVTILIVHHSEHYLYMLLMPLSRFR